MSQPALAGGRRHPSPKYKGRVYQGAGYDEERAQQRAHPTATEDHMEYGFASHVLLWLIGAMALLGLALTTLGFWVLGRSAYRKD